MDDERRFQDLVRRSAPLTYATRCRVVADEVRRLRAAPDPPAARAWLDEQLATLATEPDTVARLVLRAAGAGHANSIGMKQVRTWAYERLRPTDRVSWAAGPDSGAMWALLMAPVPADEEQLSWLAYASGVDASDLRALVPGRAGLAE